MKKAIAIIILGLVLSSNAHASWTYLQYQKIYLENKKLAQTYLWGLQTGYRFGQVAAGSNYCLPENLQLNLQNVEDIVDEQAKKMNNADNEWVAMILHLEMLSTFPCN